MISTVRVTIHPSQFPENVRQDLLQSLRTRAVNHKFHYDSIKQAQKWLALHQACSPWRTDPDCAAAYAHSCQAVVSDCEGMERLHVLALGCGDGQKELQLLRLLKRPGRSISYTPCDVSVPLVLAAHQAALEVLSPDDCTPLVCDLLSAGDLGEVLENSRGSAGPRIVTFFGLIPNFEPQTILPLLTGLLHERDRLIFSANLAPGLDYLAGLAKILPQYENVLTRDWLLTFLLDLGVERSDGQLDFVIEDGPEGSGPKRIAAYFRFHRACGIEVGRERIQFQGGESIRLFFSYRHTPIQIHELLGAHGMAVMDRWITRSEEEGVFLCRRA